MCVTEIDTEVSNQFYPRSQKTASSSVSFILIYKSN